MEKIILASASPRRYEIFEKMGLKFSVCPSDKEPEINERFSAEKTALLSAKAKARDISQKNNGYYVVGADTVVCYKGKTLGKPQNKSQAALMLRELSGKVHKVVTGVYVSGNGMDTGFVSKTWVRFYKLSDDQIEKYVESGEPMDKAGAYAIQQNGFKFVKSIYGDYLNVVGFPAAEFLRFLKKNKII